MEKAILVVFNVNGSVKHREAMSADALAELNQLLAEGWRVKHSSAMSGTAGGTSASLVILERDG